MEAALLVLRLIYILLFLALAIPLAGVLVILAVAGLSGSALAALVALWVILNIVEFIAYEGFGKKLMAWLPHYALERLHEKLFMVVLLYAILGFVLYAASTTAPPHDDHQNCKTGRVCWVQAANRPEVR